MPLFKAKQKLIKWATRRGEKALMNHHAILRANGLCSGVFPPEMLETLRHPSAEGEIWPLEFYSIKAKVQECPKWDHFVVGLVSVRSYIKLSIHPAALPGFISQPSQQLVRWRLRRAAAPWAVPAGRRESQPSPGIPRHLPGGCSGNGGHCPRLERFAPVTDFEAQI